MEVRPRDRGTDRTAACRFLRRDDRTGSAQGPPEAQDRQNLVTDPSRHNQWDTYSMETLIFVATSKEIALREVARLRPRNGPFDDQIRIAVEAETLEEGSVFVVDCRETTHPSTPYVQQVRVARP